MSRKNIIIVGVVIIAILLLIVGVIISKKNNGNEDNRTVKLYNKMIETSNFTFSMEEQNNDIDYKVEMVQRGSDFCIEMNSDEEHTTTLVLDNQAYYIMHEEKEYYKFEDEDEEEVDADIIIDSLGQMIQNKCTTGKEKINGNLYDYDEFENDGIGFVIFAEINERSKIKTRFYYDKDQIVYIKNIVTDDDGVQEELIKANLSNEIDESLFKLPEDYTQVLE